MAIPINTDLSDAEKAKYLLDQENKDLLKIDKVIPILIKSMSMDISYENMGYSEVEIKFVLVPSSRKETFNLKPEKHYALVEF